MIYLLNDEIPFKAYTSVEELREDFIDNMKRVKYCRMLTSLQADEKALRHIKEQYQQYNTPFEYNIPMNRDNTTMIWYGDIAKTILANL